MKKKWQEGAPGKIFPGAVKILLKMKLTLCVLLISFLGTMASESYSQTTKLSLDLKNAKVKDALGAIESQSEFFFLYSEKLINVDREVNIEVQGSTIEKILDKIFEGTNVSYTVKGRQIVLATPEANNLVETSSVSQQQKKVTGKVTDSSGASLPGVTVAIKGTTKGTITDENGNYSLSEIPENATLMFSFVGMKAQETSVGSKTIINLVMQEETIGMQEVVVVGYGTQKKQAVTGAVSQADVKTYSVVPQNNIMQTLKGTTAGLNISGTNKAGEVPTITIRGKNSINAGSNPLIVVDGAIFAGSLNDIATDDIESFTVLKDASAAAVYGSRSANGVIIIETKKGSAVIGKPQFSVNINEGVSTQLKPLEVYDGLGYTQRILDIRQANNLDHDPSKVATYMQPIESANYNATPNHAPTVLNPASLFTQIGQSLNTTLSVSSKTENTQYYISFNAIDQKGVIIDDIYKHYGARVNFESKLTNWFNLGVKAYYSLNSYPGAPIYGLSGGGSPSSPNYFSPYAKLKDTDGSYTQFPQTTTSFPSPYWQIPDQHYNKQNNLSGILSALVKVPWITGLTYTMTLSNSYYGNEKGSFYGLKTIIGNPVSGSGDMGYNRGYTVLFDNIVKYNRTIGKHIIDLTMLYSTENYSGTSMASHGEGFDDTSLGYFGLSKGKLQTVSTGGTNTAAVGEMARLTYSYANKYTITGTIRKDGFSAFSNNHKYGTFPSIGVNWNLSNEKFMKNVKSVNLLSLRASYGSNGNQSISPYQSLSKIGNGKYIYYGSSSYVFTQYVSNLGNSDLMWESTTGLNLGMDFSILKNRISGSIDGYSKHTTNLMFPRSLPTTSGFSTITANLGEIGNKGVEINLKTVNIDRGSFKWKSDFSFSLNRNKLNHIFGPDSTGVEKDLVSQGYFIGKSLGTIYDYKITGMWQAADSIGGNIMKGMRPGTYKLLDVNNDGKITSDQDRVFTGNSDPNFVWSFTNTFEYKKFSLMFYIYSMWGGNGYFMAPNTPYTDSYAGREEINHAKYDYWTPTNTAAMFPRPNYVQVASYRGTKYFDRSFIKLQKVTISYNLTDFVKRIGIKSMSFTLSADNLFTYAPHWIGLDPETGIVNRSTGIVDTRTANGLTDLSIPSTRTISAGLNFNF